MHTQVLYSEAFERKLRPIYDAIDGRSYKVEARPMESLLRCFTQDCLALIEFSSFFSECP